MNQLTGKKILVWTSLCVGAAYPFYCWVAGVGLYRWLVDLELARQGKGPYVAHERWLLYLTFFITVVTIFALSRPALYIIDHLLPPPAAIIEAPRPAPKPMTDVPTPAPAASKATRNPVVICLLVGSLVVVVVGVCAGVIAYRKSLEPVTFEAFNLADGAPPSSKYVKLTGPLALARSYPGLLFRTDPSEPASWL